MGNCEIVLNQVHRSNCLDKQPTKQSAKQPFKQRGDNETNVNVHIVKNVSIVKNVDIITNVCLIANGCIITNVLIETIIVNLEIIVDLFIIVNLKNVCK